MRKARIDDIPLLLDLMEEFYAEAGYKLNRLHAEQAFANLLADDRLGHVWIIDEDGGDAGYLVLTLKYAMEYGGMIGCLDDLFVKPAFRNRGLSSEALRQVRTFCKQSGTRALTVEVGRDNGPAQTVYRRTGFEEMDRQLLTLPLDDPSHVT